MKKILLLSAFLSIYLSSFGQVNTYTFASSTGTYTPLAGGTAVIPPNTSISGTGWAEQSINVPLPFVYYFNGQGYSSVFVNSNGYVTFGASASAANPRPHTSNNGQSGSIVGYGCGTSYIYNNPPGYPLGSGGPLLGGLTDYSNANPIIYSTLGSAPNRIFVVQWTNSYRVIALIQQSGTAVENYTFQIRMYESSNVAELVYNSGTTNYTPLANPTVGICGSSTADFNLLNGASWTSVTNSTVSTGVTLPFNPGVSIPAGVTFDFTPPPALMPVACSGTPPAPTVIANTGITCSTVALSLSGLPLATGLTYQWQSSATGLPNSWTNISGATSFTFTPTLTATTYFQCLLACGGGPQVASNSVGIGYESTCPAITSYTYNTSYTYASCTVGSFTIAGGACGTTFNDVNNTVGSYGYTVYNGGGGTQYDYIDLTNNPAHFKFQGSTSTSSTFSATINNYANNTSAYGVWIDLNDNGSFADAGEFVGNVPAVLSAPIVFTITIPANNFGIHRMRVRGAWTGGYTSTTIPPTGAILYFGQAKDYAIEITPPPPTATNNSPVCATGTLQLTSAALAGATYTWSGPLSYYSTTSSTTQNYVVPGPAASGVYSLSTTVSGANACAPATTTVTVNAQPVAAPSNSGPICVGGTVNLNANATLGAGGYIYSWSGPNLSSTTSATPSATPTVTSTYSLTVSNAASGCSSGIVYTTTVSVNPTPIAAPTNNGPICVSGTVNLTANPGGGATLFTWTGPNIPTPSAMNPTATPTATVTYSLTVSSGASSGCSPATIYTTAVTVAAKPTAAPANDGPTCVFGTIHLTASPAGGTGPYLYTWGGAFLSSTTAAAPTATPGATSLYTLLISNAASGCSSGIVYATLATVNSKPTAVVANNSPMCTGGTANLSAIPSGGIGAYIYTWSGAGLSSTTIANPTASPASTTVYSLTVSNASSGCISSLLTTTVTVNPKPTAAPANDGPICNTGTLHLSANATGGVGTYLYTWSGTSLSSTTIANPSATPTIPTTYSLTVSNVASGCSTGTVYTTAAIVNPQPSAAPTNDGPICASGTLNLAANATGGTGSYIYSWSGSSLSSTTAGNTTATPGLTNTYSLTVSNAASGCSPGTIYTTAATVNPQPTATPSNDGPICIGHTVDLSANAAGGIGGYIYNWSGPNLSSSTDANPTATPTTTATYSLTVSNLPSGCNPGTVYTSTVIVNPLPSAISGPTVVCQGASVTLSDAGGGTWSSSNGNVYVDPGTGIVTGINVGTSTITYTLPTGCIATAPITVNPAPGVISGITQVCAGFTTTLSDAGLGTWSSSNGNASVGSATGYVTGVTAGASIITYTLPVTGCFATTNFIVNPTPSPIIGLPVLCQGTIDGLSDLNPGGTWTSSNTLAATVGSATGNVTGVSPGTSVITYTLPTGCIITKTVTVHATPNVSDFTSPTAAPVCINSASTVVVNSTSLGTGTFTATYDLAGANIATGNTATLIMGPASGVFTTSVLASSGSTTVTITSITNGLGCTTLTSGSNTVTFNVNPLPAPITGGTVICRGSATTLSDTGGGTWASSSPAIASIGSTSGIVIGNATGTATITYSLPTGCTASAIVTVNPLPLVVTGPNTVCAGSAITVSDVTFGGHWSSSDITLATVTFSTGIVTGVSAGVPMITYTLPTGCLATKTITVNPLPVTPAAITGTAAVCAGATTTLSNVTPGGTWSSSDNTVATISPLGITSGVAAGTATISYTESNGCGSYAATKVVTVNPLPISPSAISGSANACIGATTPLSDLVPGGTWSSLSPAIATIDPSGVVTGVAAGPDSIKYTITNGCGSAFITRTITVNPLTNAGIITGPTNVCAGALITLADTIPGGTWSGSTFRTTVSSGVVTGIAAGIDTIKYAVPGICGIATATQIITVDPTPIASPITGPTDVCVGAAITLTDAATGGTWTGSSSTAGVTSGGVVTGISTGIDTIKYTLSGACATYGAAKQIVNIHPLPNTYTLTGGGGYCPAGTGVHVGLAGSQASTLYQLYHGTTAIGAPMTGTGTAIDFGIYADTGTYTVYAWNPVTACYKTMTGNARVAIDTLILPDVYIYAVSSTDVTVGEIVTFTAIVTNGITAYGYHWQINGTDVASDTTDTYVSNRLMLFDNDVITCTIKGFGPCGEVDGTKSLNINLHDVGVNQVTTGNADVKVVPNPSKGEFTIKGFLGTSANEEVSLELTDVIGQVVYQSKVTAHNGNINEHVQLKNALANGMYILNLRSGVQNKVFHIVIEQ